MSTTRFDPITRRRSDVPPTSALVEALDLVDALERARHAAGGRNLAQGIAAVDLLGAVDLVAAITAAVELAADAAENIADAIYGPGLADAMTCQDGRTANLAHRVAVTLGNLGRNVL